MILVGIIEPVGGHGGMDYYDYGLSFGLGLNDVNIRFYTSGETNVREYSNVRTLLYFNNMWRRHILIKSLRYVYGHLKAYMDLRKNKGQLIHLHFFSFRSIDLLILILAKLFKFKIVATIHDVNSFDRSSNEYIEKLCFKLLDKIIVHNESSFLQMRKKVRNYTKISIIPHGNYLPFVTPIVYKHVSKVFTLLFFGQIKKVKGLDILINAVADLRDQGLEVKLIIAGKPWKSELEDYKRQIDDLELNDRIITDFRYIQDNEISSFYEQADLVVLPYREIYQSGVVLLTMSYGRPVLCSNLEPFKEIIGEEINGFLFSSEDHLDMSKKIKSIMNNRKLLDDTTIKANMMIRDKFDWVTIGNKTKELYTSLLR